MAKEVTKTTYPTMETCAETMVELKTAYLDGPILVPSLIANEKDLIIGKTANLEKMYLDTKTSLVWIYCSGLDSAKNKRTEVSGFSSVRMKNWLVAQK